MSRQTSEQIDFSTCSSPLKETSKNQPSTRSSQYLLQGVKPTSASQGSEVLQKQTESDCPLELQVEEPHKEEQLISSLKHKGKEVVGSEATQRDWREQPNPNDSNMFPHFSRQGGEQFLTDANKKLQFQVTELTRQLHEEKTHSLQKSKRDHQADLLHMKKMAALIESLREKNSHLEGLLEDAQSHISRLQPYHKELTPREAAQGHENLSHQCWDGLDAQNKLLAHAKHRPAHLSPFLKAVNGHIDLSAAKDALDSDEDLVVAMIMRYLQEQVFQDDLHGTLPFYSEVFDHVVNSMKCFSVPKRDMYAIRNWKTEACAAIFAHPDFKPIRDEQCKELTANLFQQLSILCPEPKGEKFKQSLLEKCIKPAVALSEKFHTSVREYRLQTEEVFWFDEAENQVFFKPSFFEDINGMNCTNALDNRKTFRLSSLQPKPDKNDLIDRLLPLCIISPALHLRKVQRNKDVADDTSVICKQDMLIGWGSAGEWKKYWRTTGHTLACRLQSLATLD